MNFSCILSVTLISQWPRITKTTQQFHLDGETIGKVENSWGFFCDCEQISTLDCEFAKKIVISLQTAAIACHSTTMYVLILLRQNNVRIAGRTQLWNTHYILDNHSRHLIALLMRWSSWVDHGALPLPASYKCLLKVWEITPPISPHERSLKDKKRERSWVSRINGRKNLNKLWNLKRDWLGKP